MGMTPDNCRYESKPPTETKVCNTSIVCPGIPSLIITSLFLFSSLMFQLGLQITQCCIPFCLWFL